MKTTKTIIYKVEDLGTGKIRRFSKDAWENRHSKTGDFRLIETEEVEEKRKPKGYTQDQNDQNLQQPIKITQAATDNNSGCGC